MEHRGFGGGSETIWYDSVMLDTWYYTLVKTHRIYNANMKIVNPDVNYSL